MAEGFLIETPKENTMSMEEIGNDYFHSLLSSFFFLDVEKDDDGAIATCKMHDLVHDLARSVIGNHECLIVESVIDIDYISEATRRLNLLVDLNKDMLHKVVEALKKAKNLRTIFVQQPFHFDIGNAFNENKRLRVLNFSGYVEELTSSIGGLKHLRYLHLPQWFIIPKGIGRLNFLQTLGVFNVGDKKENKNVGGIEELEGLSLLRGDLRINNLGNVTSGIDACRANLKEKKNLRDLHLSWEVYHHDATNDEVVLEGLEPHPNLRALGIANFLGSKLPNWIEDSSCLPNLVYLRLYGGMLLKSLTLRSTASTGEASTTTIAFPSLKKLTLNFMPTLKEWVVPVPVPVPPQGSTTGATSCFPLLEEIEIKYCYNLSTITPTTTIFPSLKVLILYKIDDGRAAVVDTLVTNNLKSLTSLTLAYLPNLISLPRQGLLENNNTLLSLEIFLCKQFEGFWDEDDDDDDDDVFSSSSSSSSALQSLKLDDCPALRYYPNFRSLTSLRSLEIQECNISKSLQEELTCLPSSLEQHLEHVQILKTNIATAEEEVVFEWRKSNE